MLQCLVVDLIPGRIVTSPRLSPLLFRRTKGLKLRLHHDHSKLNGSVALRYQKIQSNETGSLSVKKKTIRLCRDPERKLSGTSNFHDVAIPEVIDNLPESVDLSILDDVPRQRTASVSLNETTLLLSCNLTLL